MSSVNTLLDRPIRLAGDRPVMTRDQALGLARKILEMTSGDTASVVVRHTATVVTRMANSQVLSGDDGDEVEIQLGTAFGERHMYITINQLDEATLREMVARAEALGRQQVGRVEQVIPRIKPTPDNIPVTHLWQEGTIRAMRSTRGSIVPEMMSAVSKRGLRAAGFLGLMARVEAEVSKDGLEASYEETDSELTITARAPDRKASGWGGAAARNWESIKPDAVVAHAIETAERSANPVGIEPGRRTAILSPAAVIQILRYLGRQFDAGDTDRGFTSFSRMPHGNRRGERFFDPRINITSDPADPEGGYCPYFQGGYASPAMDWIENGVLKNLAYDVRYGMARGKQYAAVPSSFRISGGNTSIDEMISQCREGIYVNRFANVELIDRLTCLVTGITRDGCFLIKDGKIAKSAKNFRFLDSPFFFLNNIEALGAPARGAFGFTPPGFIENKSQSEWPRPPMIAPLMMVRDFNFNGVADAV